MPAPTVRTLAALLLAVAVTACSSSEGTYPGPPPSAPAESSTVQPSPEPAGNGGGVGDRNGDGSVPEVLRFSAPRLGGGTVDGEEFSGGDVALWFWAPW